MDPQGRPIAGARLVPDPEGPDAGRQPEAAAASDADGIVRLAAGAGPVKARLVAEGFVPKTLDTIAPAPETQDKPASVAEAPPVAVVLDPATWVRGRVMDLAGAAVAGATVRATSGFAVHDCMRKGNHAPPSVWCARTGADGWYELGPIPAGRAQHWFAEAPDGSCAATCGWSPGPGAFPRDWWVAPPVQIRGELLNAAGKPLAGREIELRRALDDGSGFVSIGSLPCRTQTDGEGRFEFSRADLRGSGGRIPWGRYELTAALDPRVPPTPPPVPAPPRPGSEVRPVPAPPRPGSEVRAEVNVAPGQSEVRVVLQEGASG